MNGGDKGGACAADSGEACGGRSWGGGAHAGEGTWPCRACEGQGWVEGPALARVAASFAVGCCRS